MCGLVGVYSSNMFARHKDCLAALLYLDTWRGRDSTGVAAVRKNADTAILKSTVPGYEFVEGPKLEAHLKLDDFCWIGHNRFGTVGRNIKTNAHPFDILDDAGSCLLVGAHNGTLKNKHVLQDHAKFGTDSEALFNHIANTSLEDTLPLIEGAWALTFYDHVAEELKIIRNKERPLFYAWEEGKKTLIWASEMWMIRVACSRSNIKLEEDKVFSFAEDTLYSFPAPEKMNDEITVERKGGLVGKTPAFFQGWTGGTNSWRKEAHEARKTGTQTSSSAAALAAGMQSGTSQASSGEMQTLGKPPSSNDAPKSPDKDDKVRDILSAKKFKGYAGVALSKSELENQLANGCGWCETEFISQRDKYAWLAPGKAVCAKCLEGEHEEIKTPANVSVH